METETVVAPNNRTASMPNRKKFLFHVNQQTHDGVLRMTDSSVLPLKPEGKSQLKNYQRSNFRSTQMQNRFYIVSSGGQASPHYGIADRVSLEISQKHRDNTHSDSRIRRDGTEKLPALQNKQHSNGSNRKNIFQINGKTDATTQLHQRLNMYLKEPKLVQNGFVRHVYEDREKTPLELITRSPEQSNVGKLIEVDQVSKKKKATN